MLRCLFKQQWRKALFLILLFCGVYALQEETEVMFTANTVPYQKTYLAQLDLSDKDTVFAQLDEDEAYTRKIHNAIQYYEGYTGDTPEGVLNIMEILSGSAVYADYDMLVWQDAMWDAPGIFAETVFYDFMTIFQLSSRLENQRRLENNLENQKEIMRRGIKRGGEKLGMYHYTLNQLNSIDTDIPVADTYYTEKLLSFLESDWYIIALLILSAFGAFSSGIQSQVTKQVLISPMGMRKYALSQMAASLLISLGAMAVYYGIVILLCCAGNLGNIPWQHPIQAINTYENILQNISLLDYVLLQLGLKICFCVAVTCIVLLISAVSPGNLVSALGSLLLFGGLLLASGRTGLAIGNCRGLLEELCYFSWNGYLLDHSILFLVGCLCVAAIAVALLIWFSPHAARKWVK